MAKLSTLKNQLAVTTALAAAMFGYGRKAYAACTVVVSPTYKCSGATATAQYINVNEATVYTAAGLSVVTASNQAITVTGDGAISFTDANASTITGKYFGLWVQAYAPDDGIIPGSVTITSTNTGSTITGTKNTGLFAYNQGKGAVSVTFDGTTTGKYQGIYGGNFGTDLTITTGVGSTSTGTGITANGIFARNKGSGILTLDVNGTATAKYFGIIAINFGTDLDITTGASSSVTAPTGAAAVGILANNYGSGAVTLTANGIVTGKWDGISAYNSGSGTGVLTVTTGAASTVTGTNDYGIHAINKGTNAEVITINGAVTSKKQTINAYNSAASTALTINTAAGSTVTSTGAGFDAIQANNGGNGALTINAYGTVTGKNTGIYATNSAASTDLTINTGTGKTIKGQTTYGIRGFNNGSGTFSITANGDVEGASSGIYARSFGTSGDLIINTVYNSTITGSSRYGIDAGEFGTGALTIGADGNVTGFYRGITAYNAGASLTINTGAGKTVTGYTKQGIYAKNTNGYLSIDAEGDVTGYTHGIWSSNSASGTSLTITTGAGGTVTGTNGIGVYGNNKGSGNLTINAYGNVTGSWRGIYAYNYGGALNIATAAGTTVTGTNELGIIARNDGNGALTITADGNVSGNTTGIYALNTVNTIDDLTITTGQYGTITGAAYYGISARNFGNGALTIAANGDVTGNTHGILARNSASGTDLTVNTGTGGTVTGTNNDGIYALNEGTSDLMITANGDISGNNRGIRAVNKYGVDLTVTTGIGTTVIGTNFEGIFAKNSGSGDLTVTASGDVSGLGASYDGIYAYNTSSSTGALTIGADGTITGGSRGIHAYNRGDGMLSVSTTGDVSGGGDGIYTRNFGTNLSVTTGPLGIISGTGLLRWGISGYNKGSGYLNISAGGTVTGPADGIRAYNYGTSLTVDTGVGSTVTGTNKSGIFTKNFGSSKLSIAADGDITGKTFGIWSRNYLGTDLAVITGAGTTVTGTTGDGINAYNSGSKALTVTADGDVSASNIGIATRNYGTDLAINTGAGTTVTGTTNIGIYAGNFGSGKLTVTADGDVTGGIRGIYARSFGGSTDLTVNTGAGTAITGNTIEGILAYTSSTGALSITADGGVTGNTRGIWAHNTASSSGITIDTGASSAVTGKTQQGIYGYNKGSKALTITAGGIVTGSTYGIQARNKAGTDLAITAAAGSTITGTNKRGIEGRNYGNSYLSITANGDVMGKTTGIWARNSVSGTSLTVNTGAGTTVTGTINYGIWARNYGSDTLSVTTLGDVTGYNGIYTRNYGTSLTVNTGTGTTVTSTNATGIDAVNFGDSYLTITANGDVTADNQGIYAFNKGTDLTITTAAGTTITATVATAITANNTTGTGAVLIDVAGDVTGRRGIYARNYINGTDLTVTTAAGTTITGTGPSNDGIDVSSSGSGPVLIDIGGDVTGAFSGILASNNSAASAGALTVITETGTTVKGTVFYGIGAFNNSMNKLVINAYGDVSGGYKGIGASNFTNGTDLIITTGAGTTVKSFTVPGGTHYYDYYGIFASNTGSGILAITTGGDVMGGDDGIYAKSSGAGLTVTTEADTTVTGTNINGILARNTGASYLTINAGGDVAGGLLGIRAENSKTGTNLAVNTEAGTTITGTTISGIYTRNAGTGYLKINADGDVTGAGGIGAENYGSYLTIDTGVGTTITGTSGIGIFADNKGIGALTITTDGGVTGTSNGILASNAAGSGALLITTNSTVTSTSSNGIWALNSGSGILSISTYDDILGGTDGIRASNSGASLTVTTDAGTTITGNGDTGISANNSGIGALTLTVNSDDVTGGQKGVYAYNSAASAGALSVTAAGTVTGTSLDGIEAKNKGTGALTIDTEDDVTGGQKGIYAYNFTNSTGALSITAGGDVTGTSKYGIQAKNYTTSASSSLSITAGNVTSNGSGIQARNKAGALTIGISGAVVANGGPGVYGTNTSGTDINITTDAGSSVKALSWAIGAYNNGTGTATIDVGGDATGGQFGVIAVNHGSGALTITTEGKISGASVAGIVGSNTGLDMTITAATDVLSKSGTGIWAINSKGLLSITTYGDVLAGTIGINATNTGNSTLMIATHGDVTGNITGIDAQNGATSDDMTITTETGTTVTGLGENGIRAQNIGSGALLITAGGAVTGLGIGYDGILAYNSSSAGALTITTSGTISGVFDGIDANNNGSGTASIDIGGDVTGGSSGIVASNSGPGVLKITTKVGTTVTGTAAYGISAFNTGADSLSISVSGNVSGGYNGVRAANNGGGYLTITNKTGSVISGGTKGIFALSGGGGYGIITNQAGATISGATGIHVTGNALATGGIDTTGTIKGTGGTAISLTGLSASTPITVNGGNIIGNTIDDAPSNGFSPVTIAGDFTSEGDFDVSDFDISEDVTFTLGKGFTISSFNTVDIDGTMIIPTDPTITGSVNVHDIDHSHSGLLQVDADTTITGDLINDGKVAIATGTLVKAGTMSAGVGTLSFGVTSKTDHGQLTLDSSPGYITGQTITIDVANINSISPSDKILLVDGTTTLIGGPGKAGVPVIDNSLLWGFKIIDGTGITDNSDLYLAVSFASPGSGGPATPNNANAAETLLDLPGPLDPVLQEIVDSFTDAPTPGELNDILESVQPAEDGGSVVSTLTFVDNSINLTGERLNTLREIGVSGFDSHDLDMTGLSAGDAPDMSDQRVWGQVSGQAARQNSREGIAGFDSALVAGTLGMDTENILENAVVGLAFSYGNTHIDSRNINRTDTDIDSYQATLYSDYDLDRGYYVTGIASGAFNTHTTVRHDVGAIPGLNAYGDFDSWQAAARAEAGRAFYVGYGTFTPIALLNWVYYNAGDYTETGAGGASLHVGTQALNQFDLGLGAKVSSKFTNADGARLVPEIHTSYRREMLGEKLETSSAFVGGGAAFSGESPTPAQDKFNFGTQLKYYSIDNLELTASYDLDLKAGFVAHSGFIRAGWKF